MEDCCIAIYMYPCFTSTTLGLGHVKELNMMTGTYKPLAHVNPGNWGVLGQIKKNNVVSRPCPLIFQDFEIFLFPYLLNNHF